MWALRKRLGCRRVQSSESWSPGYRLVCTDSGPGDWMRLCAQQLRSQNLECRHKENCPRTSVPSRVGSKVHSKQKVGWGSELRAQRSPATALSLGEGFRGGASVSLCRACSCRGCWLPQWLKWQESSVESTLMNTVEFTGLPHCKSCGEWYHHCWEPQWQRLRGVLIVGTAPQWSSACAWPWYQHSLCSQPDASSLPVSPYDLFSVVIL